jgi:hypothetical protein
MVISFSMFSVEVFPLPESYWILDAGCWLLDAGYWQPAFQIRYHFGSVKTILISAHPKTAVFR